MGIALGNSQENGIKRWKTIYTGKGNQRTMEINETKNNSRENLGFFSFQAKIVKSFSFKKSISIGLRFHAPSKPPVSQPKMSDREKRKEKRAP